MPNDSRFIKYSGSIRNPQTDFCWDTLSLSSEGSRFSVNICEAPGPTNSGNQVFLFTQKQEIRVGSGEYSVCVDAGDPNGFLIVSNSLLILSSF